MTIIRMMMTAARRHLVPGFMIATMICAGGAPGYAQSAGRTKLQRGEALLTQNCGRCHAVGKTGESAHHLAPPFRILGQRYTIDSLEEALGEGLISGHPDMPEFTFPPRDVGAIVTYLKSIQTKH